MAVLTIRDFDDDLKAKLRVGSRLRQRFADVDHLSFEPPRRVEQARAAEVPE
jgi:plasmid stability protein